VSIRTSTTSRVASRSKTLTADFREDIVWYQEYSSERAANTFFSGGWIVPLNRLAFGFDGTYLNARERPVGQTTFERSVWDLVTMWVVRCASASTSIGRGATPTSSGIAMRAIGRECR
jgi:hypothetical protein